MRGLRQDMHPRALPDDAAQVHQNAQIDLRQSTWRVRRGLARAAGIGQLTGAPDCLAYIRAGTKRLLLAGGTSFGGAVFGDGASDVKAAWHPSPPVGNSADMPVLSIVQSGATLVVSWVQLNPYVLGVRLWRDGEYLGGCAGTEYADTPPAPGTYQYVAAFSYLNGDVGPKGPPASATLYSQAFTDTFLDTAEKLLSAHDAAVWQAGTDEIPHEAYMFCDTGGKARCDADCLYMGTACYKSGITVPILIESTLSSAGGTPDATRDCWLFALDYTLGTILLRVTRNVTGNTYSVEIAQRTQAGVLQSYVTKTATGSLPTTGLQIMINTNWKATVYFGSLAFHKQLTPVTTACTLHAHLTGSLGSAYMYLNDLTVKSSAVVGSLLLAAPYLHWFTPTSGPPDSKVEFYGLPAFGSAKPAVYFGAVQADPTYVGVTSRHKLTAYVPVSAPVGSCIVRVVSPWGREWRSSWSLPSGTFTVS